MYFVQSTNTVESRQVEMGNSGITFESKIEVARVWLISSVLILAIAVI